MNSIVRFKSPSLAEFFDSPVKPFAESNLSIFDEFFDGIFQESRNFLPYNTIAVDESNYLIEVALAGFSKEDFKVSLDGNRLNIYSIKNESVTTEERKPQAFPAYIHRGIAKRGFSLSFTIPKGAEVSDPEFKDGLLTIKITKPVPKKTEARLLTVK